MIWDVPYKVCKDLWWMFANLISLFRMFWIILVALCTNWLIGLQSCFGFSEFDIFKKEGQRREIDGFAFRKKLWYVKRQLKFRTSFELFTDNTLVETGKFYNLQSLQFSLAETDMHNRNAVNLVKRKFPFSTLIFLVRETSLFVVLKYTIHFPLLSRSYSSNDVRQIGCLL